MSNLLRPMLFIPVAIVVATVGGWSILAEEGGASGPNGPGFAAPVQTARVTRISEGLNETIGTIPLPVIGLPDAVAFPSPHAHFTQVRSQARPLASLRAGCAGLANRGPPRA